MKPNGGIGPDTMSQSCWAPAPRADARSRLRPVSRAAATGGRSSGREGRMDRRTRALWPLSREG
jgi:hypothetical protein